MLHATSCNVYACSNCGNCDFVSDCHQLIASVAKNGKNNDIICRNKSRLGPKWVIPSTELLDKMDNDPTIYHQQCAASSPVRKFATSQQHSRWEHRRSAQFIMSQFANQIAQLWQVESVANGAHPSKQTHDIFSRTTKWSKSSSALMEAIS